MKKILSVLLAVMMLLSCLPVMADEAEVAHKREDCPKTIVSADGLHKACEKDAASDYVPATCTVAGHQDFYCQVDQCDAVFTVYNEKDPAKKHSPKLHESGEYADKPVAEVVTPATCEVPGVQKLFCTKCEEYYTAPIEALKHQWVDVEEEFFVGTCTEDAYKVRYCTNATCPLAGAHQKYDIVEAPGHNFSQLKAFVEDVDCETSGIYELYYTCSHNSAWKDPNGEYYKWNCEEHSKTAVASVELKKEEIAKLHQAALEEFIAPTEKDAEAAKAAKVSVEYIIAETVAGLMNDKNIVSVGSKVYPGTNYEGMEYFIDFEAEVEYKKATCEEPGYMKLTCTTETGACYVSFEIPALGHIYTMYNEDGELFKEKDATCLKNGSAIVKCENPYVDECDFIEQVEIKAPGKHNFVHDPDCNWGNSYWQKDCLVTITQEYELNKEPVVITIPAYEYTKNAEFIAKIAPCTEYTVVAHCCGFVLDVDLKNGETFWYHIDCDAKDAAYTVDGDETKHVFDETKFAHESATCTEDGWDISYCTACGKNTYREYKAWNHVDPATGYSAYVIENYKTDVVEATCTEPGSMKLTCYLCDDVQTKVIPATGHGWDKDNEGNPRNDYRVVVTKKMTCKEAGSATWYCNYCQATQVHPIPIKHVEPTDASKIVVTDSTCTIAGSKTYVCESCHDSIVEEIPAKGHTFERAGYVTEYKYEGKYYDGYVPATCLNEAYYWRVCNDPRCDKAHKDLKLMIVGDYIIGKHYEVAVSGEKLDHLLVVDGLIIEGQPIDIDVNLIITKLPTCGTAGEATFNCAHCGKRATIVLPALGHNEKVTWNKEKRIYEITCQPYNLKDDNAAKANFEKYMIKNNDRNYMYDAIMSRIDPKIAKVIRVEVTKWIQSEIIEDLATKMIQKKDINNDKVLENIVRGVGCKEVIREIKVNQTHYDATMKDNGDGTLAIEIEIVENAAKLPEPRLIVSWAYTLSDGTSMTVTGNYGAPADAYWNDDGNYANVVKFTVPAPEVDFTTELVQTTIAVTTGYSTDMSAAYANGYGWDVIVAK